MKKAVITFTMLVMLPTTVFAAWEFKKSKGDEKKSETAKLKSEAGKMKSETKKVEKAAVKTQRGRYVIQKRADGGEFILDTQTGTINPAGITTEQTS